MAAPSEVNGDPIHCAAKVPAMAYPLSEESAEVAANIKYHSQYSPHFSPFKFEPEQAYYATAESVRDSLIKFPVQINDVALDFYSDGMNTYLCFHEVDPKQTYYLSMEYLQGRMLTNAIGNLNILDVYADALHKLGSDIENIAEQRPLVKELEKFDPCMSLPISYCGYKVLVEGIGSISAKVNFNLAMPCSINASKRQA
ncbi:alpha-glucan phosphorylase, H isozyme-like [Nymphaea colorata]|nr:alpha-glucan phosphorylase, H isozyme-like [Nymphaea colorata]